MLYPCDVIRYVELLGTVTVQRLCDALETHGVSYDQFTALVDAYQHVPAVATVLRASAIGGGCGEREEGVGGEKEEWTKAVRGDSLLVQLQVGQAVWGAALVHPLLLDMHALVTSHEQGNLDGVGDRAYVSCMQMSAALDRVMAMRLSGDGGYGIGGGDDEGEEGGGVMAAVSLLVRVVLPG